MKDSLSCISSLKTLAVFKPSVLMANLSIFSYLGDVHTYHSSIEYTEVIWISICAIQLALERVNVENDLKRLISITWPLDISLKASSPSVPGGTWRG